MHAVGQQLCVAAGQVPHVQIVQSLMFKQAVDCSACIARFAFNMYICGLAVADSSTEDDYVHCSLWSRHHIQTQLLPLVLPVLFQTAMYEICVFPASLRIQHGCIYMYMQHSLLLGVVILLDVSQNAVVSAALTGQGLPPCLPTTFVRGELRCDLSAVVACCCAGSIALMFDWQENIYRPTCSAQVIKGLLKDYHLPQHT